MWIMELTYEKTMLSPAIYVYFFETKNVNYFILYCMFCVIFFDSTFLSVYYSFLFHFNKFFINNSFWSISW